MTDERIRAAIGAATEYLTTHPDEARYTDTVAVAVVDGLRTTVTGSEGESLVTDMPQSVGGGDTAPSPGWLLRAAMASCVATLITMRGAVTKLEVTDLEVTVDSESDDRGILGVDDSVPAGPLRARIRVRIASSTASETQLREIIDWAHRHCPVSDAVGRAVPTTLEVDVT